MKLKTKVFSYFFLTTSIVFTLIATILFFSLRKTLNDDAEQKLKSLYHNVTLQKEKIQTISLPPIIIVNDTVATITPPSISKVLLHVENENEFEEFAEMKGVELINGKNYFILVRVSLVENEDLMFNLFIVALLGIVLFSIISSILASKFYDRIMSPFNSSIKFLNTFSFERPQSPIFTETNIEEFKRLQESIQLFTKRILEDLTHLQDFNDMFNHELQTPIAIIQSKLELMLNDSGINQHLFEMIESSLQSLNRLKSTNKSILMLSRLRQGRSFEVSEINIIPIIKDILSNYDDIFAEKQIQAIYSIPQEYTIASNESLFNILFSNLISNAIKHNCTPGKVEITFENDILVVSNTGIELEKNVSEKIFEPFVKSSARSDGAGLGLAIVKAICTTLGFNISYSFNREQHFFSIKFRS